MRRVIQSWRRLRAWYLLRFHGFVQGPRGGTSWQQHEAGRSMYVRCRCGRSLALFYPISKRLSKAEEDEGMTARMVDGVTFSTDAPGGARISMICPGCGLGHWKPVQK